MSQRELAAAVADWVEEHYGERPGIDEKAVARVERGRIRRPSRRYRAAYRAILGAKTDADLGFSRRRATSPGDSRSVAGILADVQRRDFLLRGTAAALVGSTAAVSRLLDHPAAPEVPRNVGVTEIEQVRESLRVFGAWDYAHGGGFARLPATAQLRWAVGLLDARCPEALRPELYSVVARLADACAFMAFDDYAFPEADGLFRFALRSAEDAGDHSVRAGVLTDMALMALWVGDTSEAQALTDHALAQPDRLTATERAMVWSTQARAHGQSGDTQATLAALGRADDAFADSSPDDDPPRMSYYTAAEHAGNTGHALYDLALATDAADAEASTRHRSAVDGHPDEFARSRAHAHARLATVTMATGDPDEAADLGLAALDATGPLRSRRSGDYLRALHRVAGRHAGRPGVDELRARISASLAA